MAFADGLNFRGLAGAVNPVPAAPDPMTQYKTVGLGLEGGANGPAGWGSNYQNAVNAAAHPLGMVNGMVEYSTPASQIFSGNGRRESEIYDGWSNQAWFDANTRGYTDPITGKQNFLIDPSKINDPNFSLTKTGSYRDNSNKNGSLWTQARDTAEAIGTDVGNYFYPGSALVTDQLVSKGAQNLNDSTLGKVAQIGSGAAGAYNGNLANYGKTWDAATNWTQPGAPVTDAVPTPVGGVADAGSTSSGGGLVAQSGPLSNAPIGDTAAAARSAAGSVATAGSGATKATGLQGFVDGLLQPKNILPAIGAVGSLLSANKSGGSGGSATAPLAGVQATQQALSNQLLSQYQSGTLTAADAYKVDQWEKQQVAATKQYYASAGLGNSDMLTKALGDVTAQASAMRSTAQNQYLSQAISALGGSASSAGALVTANVAQDAALQQAQQSFFANLGRLSTTTDSQGSA